VSVRRWSIFAALLFGVALCVVAALPQVATAAYPGRPGVIVFSLGQFGGPHSSGELYSIRPWQSEPRQLTWNDSDSDPSFAPSGQRFAFLRSQPGKAGIYQYDLASSRVTRLVAGGSVGSPAFGRRGMIAFTRDTAIGRDLFLRTADGKERRLTASNDVKEEEPIFTPNGKRIVFLRRGSLRDIEVWSIRVDGRDPRLVSNGRDQYTPDISPNGRWLALENLISFLPVFELGTGIHQLPLRSDARRSGFGDAAYPAYSPGGGKIAFSNYEGIWLAQVGGGSRSLIYRTWDGPPEMPGFWPNNLAWQPLPRPRCSPYGQCAEGARRARH